MLPFADCQEDFFDSSLMSVLLEKTRMFVSLNLKNSLLCVK